VTPKAAASPVPPPATPVVTDVLLNSDGSVTIVWEGTGPTGTSYLVRRKNSGETAYVILGQTGPSNKRFADTTIPAGVTSASYTVQAVRGDDASGLSPATVVQFGPNVGVGAVEMATNAAA